MIPRRPFSAFAKLMLVASVLGLLASGTLLLSAGDDNDTETPDTAAGQFEVGPDVPPTSDASVIDLSATVVVTPEATPEPVAPTPEATLEPTPEPPPPPSHRTNCREITGTAYRSGEEREWFRQNCGAGGAPLPAAAAASAPPGPQTPIGDRLIIPAAGVNTEVYRTSVPASGVMPDPAGYFNVVRYDFSALPGLGGDLSSGNLVISGHVDCGKCNNGGAGTAVFWSVRNLKAGDTAQYRAADGTVVNYVVTVSRSFSSSTDGASVVSAGAADMTLITCTGSFSGGEYSLRHIVALNKA